MDFMEFLQAGWKMDLNMVVIQKKDRSLRAGQHQRAKTLITD